MRFISALKRARNSSSGVCTVHYHDAALHIGLLSLGLDLHTIEALLRCAEELIVFTSHLRHHKSCLRREQIPGHQIVL